MRNHVWLFVRDEIGNRLAKSEPPIEHTGPGLGALAGRWGPWLPYRCFVALGPAKVHVISSPIALIFRGGN
jgi:hypothetical protein